MASTCVGMTSTMSASHDAVKTSFWTDLGSRLRRRRKTEGVGAAAKERSQQPSIKRWNDNPDAVLASSRASRQRRLGSKIHSTIVPFLSTALPILGILWLLVLPLDRWGRTTYFDENAIQPGQVKTFWDWDDVHLADQWLAGIEGVWNGGQGTSREYV